MLVPEGREVLEVLVPEEELVPDALVSVVLVLELRVELVLDVLVPEVMCC